MKKKIKGSIDWVLENYKKYPMEYLIVNLQNRFALTRKQARDNIFQRLKQKKTHGVVEYIEQNEDK